MGKYLILQKRPKVMKKVKWGLKCVIVFVPKRFICLIKMGGFSKILDVFHIFEKWVFPIEKFSLRSLLSKKNANFPWNCKRRKYVNLTKFPSTFTHLNNGRISINKYFFNGHRWYFGNHKSSESIGKWRINSHEVKFEAIGIIIVPFHIAHFYSFGKRLKHTFTWTTSI